MIFNSKQLEELENIHDSTGAFEEEGDDEAGFDEVGEAAMDWRRGLIEEGAENIKRAKTRPVEASISYNIGSMLFDREARRFARVQRSVPGYLKIGYLSGGDRELGTLDVVGYLKDYGAEKRLSELAEQLAIADHDVALELERLGITPLEEPEAPEPEVQANQATTPAPVPPPFSRAAAPAKAPRVTEDDEDDEDAGGAGASTPAPAQPSASQGGRAPVAPVAHSNGRGVPAKASAPPAAPAKATSSAKPPAAKKPVMNGTPAPSGSKSVNPIDDPNGYIRANFQQMSNRELARVTGLSEHTIRRKLGEWGLKRKKDL